MVEIIYHPLNPRHPFFHSRGIRISLEEFLRKDEFWRDSERKRDYPLEVENPLHSRGLIDYMAHAIKIISGHEISAADIRKIGSFLQLIKNGIKGREYSIRERISSPQFILGALPYLFLGFNMDMNTRIPHSGQNTLDSAYNICVRLNGGESVELSSMLCAHKAKRSVDRHGLIDALSFNHVQRALNILGGLVDNSNVRSSRHTFYQPDGNLRDIEFVFPPLLNKYLSEGRTDEMMDKLREHLVSLRGYLKKAGTSNLTFEARDLKEIIDEAHKQVENMDQEGTSKGLAEISESLTKPGIIRLYGQFDYNPFSHSTAKSGVLSESEARVKEILDMMKDPSSLSRRALYETALYYAWGILTGQKNGISIGLEVDHERYQTLSWHKGWIKGARKSLRSPSLNSPLMYARKDRKVEGNKYIKGISLRESWR